MPPGLRVPAFNSGLKPYMSRFIKVNRATSMAVWLALIGAAAVHGADPHWDIQYQYKQFDSTLTINDFVFTSASRGVVCGYTVDRRDNHHPLVLLTKDGGQHWTETPVKEAGLSLFFLDDSTGWMVTEKGIWQTSESGYAWTKLKAPAGLSRVWFLDKRHGFAAGLEKRVFETTDAGETWNLLPIMKEVQGDPTFTTFGEIAFSGKNGIVAGWNIPPRKGGPDWMEPEKAAERRQVPNYSVMLQTKDAGTTWTKSEASLFGQITRLSLTPQGTGLGLIEFKDQFEFPSEVYRVELGSGRSERAFRQKDRAITDVHLFAGENGGLIAGYEVSGPIFRSPIPGKLKVLASDDLDTWTEVPVDYRAVAHRAMISGPDKSHLWIATDTGMILRMVKD